jgi:TRAP-type C4-dicarboxylate transport system substrate-binding protein
MVDPMQLWSSLTQQFQQIAASAMKEASKATAIDLTKTLSKGVAAKSAKADKVQAAAPAKKRAAAKKVAKKSVPPNGAERAFRRRT